MNQLPLFGRRRIYGRPSITELFESFDRENPQVWTAFERAVQTLIRAGVARYSADAVLHHLRWEHAIETRGEEFRVNNNYAAHYSRRWAQKHPDHAAFFETRERRVA